MIDWENDKSHVLLNPRMPGEERARIQQIVAETSALASHIWLASSGRSGEARLVSLSRSAIFASAAAVNRHLRATSSDIWCKPLPSFHVGGIGIYARAKLTASPLFELDQWDATSFVALCGAERVSLSSLVPAQLWDLVNLQLKPPTALRAILVGGAALPVGLYQKARELGWPVLPSYGMTECASQIATATLESLAEESNQLPPLRLLCHLGAREELDGRLSFTGTSLLTLYLKERDGKAVFEDPKKNDWFTSDDRGSVQIIGDATFVHVAGRTDDFVKIGGEAVYLSRLDQILDDVVRSSKFPDAAVYTSPDERLGSVIHLAVHTDDLKIASAVREALSLRVLPYERPRELLLVDSIPRSPLGKLLRQKLVEELPGA
ncbi:MAG TPA: AMP-binding protein [Thermoanaerobaculia bacterium]|nr:AMP-binding protein [Thermoanaerobaculia bacterium]